MQICFEGAYNKPLSFFVILRKKKTMKHYVMLLGMALLCLGACKKDKKETVKTFADYTLKDLKDQTANITAEAIPYDAPAVTNFKTGSILFFKTNVGNYGKMQVVSVSAQYDVVANIVVFDSNGAKLADKSNFTIPLSVSVAYDLDTSAIEQNLTADADFQWATLEGIRTLYFANGAKAFIYKL